MNMKVCRFQRVFLTFTILALCGGCILAPAIDSIKRAGFTKSDRMGLLGKRVKEFHEALYWGDPDGALAFADMSKRAELDPILRGMSNKNEKVVDSKIESSMFSDSAEEANVKVRVRFYKIPYYIVLERVDEQTWEFDYTDTWHLESLKKGRPG